MYRSSRPEVFCKKKGVLKNFTKFTGKHLCQSLFFNKVNSQTFTNLQKQQLQKNVSSSEYVIYITCFGECFLF